jgi:CheY-like chemotaxis protein
MEKLKSIILIDDDALENLINKKLIENLGIAHNIKALMNGREGLNYLRILTQINTPPEVIFLDINMPVMDGFEFLRAFHTLPLEFRQAIKVIVLTSSINDSDYKMAKRIGCDGYLTKPLTKDKIKEEVDRLFNS